MSEPERITIFISSPGDVIPERVRVEQTVDRLRDEFAPHFDLQTVRWEELPLRATDHFQSQIPDPSTADIVVMILWWRLGTPLKERSGWDRDWTGKLSGQEVTGTEWEFEDAVWGWQQTKKHPFVLVFQKLGVPQFDTDEQVRTYLQEKARVDDFFNRWFKDAETDTFIRAWRQFSEETDFVDMIDTQLTRLLRRRLAIRDEVRAVEWHESPFRGLEAFDVEDGPIFFGRTRAQYQLRDLLSIRAATGKPWVLVIGPSGSGKSSLVRAGLIPDIRKPGLVEGIGLCRYVIVRPSDFDGSPAAAFAAALLSDPGLPELRDLRYDEQRLRTQLVTGRDQAAFAVEQGLSTASDRAELSAHYRPLFVVVIDQLEEVFRLSGERQAELIEILDGFTAAENTWVIGTMRSDFLEQLDKQRDLSERLDPDGRYLLAAPTDFELAQMITRPARAAGLSFGMDQVTGNPLSEDLLSAARRDPASLPLLEYVLQQLWQRRSDNGELTQHAYRELGGLEGAIGAKAEKVFQALPGVAQAAFPRVLRRLVQIGQSADARPTSQVARMEAFPPGSPDAAVVNAMLAPDARLLTAGEGGAVRVAHEAVLSHWPRAVAQLETDRRDLQLMARLRSQVARLNEAPSEQRRSLLLTPGLPLSEGEDLLKRRRDELEPELVDLIEASTTAYRDEQAANLEAERLRAERAEWRRLLAEKMERRATAEEYFSRAKRTAFHAKKVDRQEWRNDRKEYASLLRKRAADLDKMAQRSLSTAYDLHLRLRDHPGAAADDNAPRIDSKVFTIEALAAPMGECLLIHYGDLQHLRLIIVGGGVVQTFDRILRPRLLKLRERRGGGTLPIELVMVGQYDADSVGGIYKMLKYLAGPGRDQFRIEQLWYNNFLPILPPDARSTDGRPDKSWKERLRDIADKLEIPVNKPFDYFVMPTDIGPAQVSFPDGLEITVVSPPAEQVRRWSRKWTADQEEHGRLALDSALLDQLQGAVEEIASNPDLIEIRKPPFDFAVPSAGALDRSVNNLSSLVVHIAFAGKRILLTSDSRSDLIMSGLFDAWMLDPERGMRVDVMTIPHFGSKRNVSPAFFEKVRADHYVVVPEKRFQLPHNKTLEMLATARRDDNFTVYFAGGGMNEELANRLRAFADGNLDLRKGTPSRMRAVFPDQPRAPVRIDLLDPLPD